jgi:hypothetical protein
MSVLLMGDTQRPTEASVAMLHCWDWGVASNLLLLALHCWGEAWLDNLLLLVLRQCAEPR